LSGFHPRKPDIEEPLSFSQIGTGLAPNALVRRGIGDYAMHLAIQVKPGKWDELILRGTEQNR
jgi:hypothetical protein